MLKKHLKDTYNKIIVDKIIKDMSIKDFLNYEPKKLCFNPDDMKIVNIILNASTSLILSLVSNFRFNERANNFKIASRKMNSLCHSIEDYIYNELDEEGNINMIRNFIKSYDDINESLDYSLINSIKNKITEKYKSSRTLPNSLNCIAGSSGILRNGEISEERNNV